MTGSTHANQLPTRRIADLEVSVVGLGGMRLSWEYMLPHRDRAIATLHTALDLGITLLDTANVYCPFWNEIGHNERLIAEALRTYTGPADLDAVVLATKGGLLRDEGDVWRRDASVDSLRRSVELSLGDLEIDAIPIYQLHRHDVRMTYADQMRSLIALKDEGLIERIGLSNVNAAEFEVALEVLGGPNDGGLVSVQNEYSPRHRGDTEVLERCGEHGIAFLPWSPLGGTDDSRAIGSRFGAIAEIADAHAATPQEIALAWLIAISPVMIPIPGATTPQTVESIVRSASIVLTADEVAQISATEPDGTSMATKDPERSPLH